MAIPKCGLMPQTLALPKPLPSVPAGPEIPVLAMEATAAIRLSALTLPPTAAEAGQRVLSPTLAEAAAAVKSKSERRALRVAAVLAARGPVATGGPALALQGSAPRATVAEAEAEAEAHPAPLAGTLTTAAAEEEVEPLRVAHPFTAATVGPAGPLRELLERSPEAAAAGPVVPAGTARTARTVRSL